MQRLTNLKYKITPERCREDKMKKEDRSILIALAIGDGYVTKDGCLVLKHSIKQKEYIEYKANLLHSILGGKKPNIIEFDNSGYPGIKTQKSNKYFRILRKRLYKNNIKQININLLKMLNPKAIAIWYMDDGNLSMKKRNGKIHARELFINTHITKEENQIIIDYFNEAYNIKFTQVKNRGSYRLRCGTLEAKKFISLVEPYIIPSMNYKINMNYGNSRLDKSAQHS